MNVLQRLSGRIGGRIDMGQLIARHLIGWGLSLRRSHPDQVHHRNGGKTAGHELDSVATALIHWLIGHSDVSFRA
jgi:hypothetical protein